MRPMLREVTTKTGRCYETTAFGLVNRVAAKSSGRPPDIVVLDCDLPGLTGFSVARQ